MKQILPLLLIVLLSYLFITSSSFLNLCFGIAIFIYGISTMSNALTSFSGGVLEKFLKKSTTSMLKSINFGIISTTLVQSSTLISVLTISFLSAGLITLAGGIGIVFGSQIGTTTGAWLIAGLGVKVDIAKYAMPIIIFGVILLFQSSKHTKDFGKILLGIGFVFLGVDFIKTGFENIDGFNLASYSVDGVKGVLLFFLIGIIITIITQSSLATIVLTISALTLEQVTYPNALSIVLGANLGTTLTALISSFGSNTNGKRLALVYLIFNIFICAISIIFLDEIIILVDTIASFIGISTNNYALKLALFHTTINIIGVLCLTPFIDNIARLMIKLIKTKQNLLNEYDDVIYLNESAFSHQGAIKEVLLKEIKHLCANSFAITAMTIFIKPSLINENSNAKLMVQSSRDIEDIDFEGLYQRRIKIIYGKIINFISIASAKEQASDIATDLSNLQQATAMIVESLKDVKHIQKNLKKYTNNNNKFISKEYNLIRENILNQLIILKKIFKSQNQNEIPEYIQTLKDGMNEYTEHIKDSLNDLIRNANISASMSSSLVNDSLYVKSISKNLIEAITIIFGENRLANIETTTSDI